MLAAIWVPIGLVGWFGPVVIVGTLATVIGLSASQLFPLLRNTLSWVRSFFKWLRGERVGVQLFAMALALLIFEFGAAAWIMPPRGDAEAFYIPYARVIAATQRIELMPGPYEYLSSIGLMGELHFGALISLANVSSAKFFVFPLAVSAAAMLVARTLPLPVPAPHQKLAGLGHSARLRSSQRERVVRVRLLQPAWAQSSYFG